MRIWYCEETSFQDEEFSMTNHSLVEEERFNVTEHRGFLHAFVEALSVILVIFHISVLRPYLLPGIRAG